MLKIKLTRLGKKKEPRYRIVVNERRDKRDGSYIAAIGYYHPAETPKALQLDISTYDKWVSQGAQPTPSVARLYEIAKTGKGFPEKKKSLSKKAKAKLEAEAAEKKQAQEKEVTPKEETTPPQEKVKEAGENVAGEATPAAKE